MYLNFFDWFFNKFTFTNLVSILIGIGLGLMIAGFFYGISVLESIKKTSKNVSNTKDNLENEQKVNEVIKYARERYDIECKRKKISEKVDLAKMIVKDLVNEIAKVYYPKSKKPMWEISIEEVIKLSYYITERIDKVFDYKALTLVKKLRIKWIVSFTEMKKTYDNSEALKTTNIARKVFFYVKNALDPSYWIRKALTHFATKYGTDKVIRIIIDIVGEESAKVYSKSLFSQSDDLKQLEDELETVEVEAE